MGVELEDGCAVTVASSVGIAQLANGQTPEEPIKLADQALYSAKQAGRNQVLCHCRALTGLPAMRLCLAKAD